MVKILLPVALLLVLSIFLVSQKYNKINTALTPSSAPAAIDQATVPQVDENDPCADPTTSKYDADCDEGDNVNPADLAGPD